MAKSEQRLSERPLTVDIPGPGADQPAWSKVGIIAVLGFVVGIAWPRLVGIKVGPAVPADLRAQVEAAPAHSASAPPGSAAGSSSAATAGSASAAPGEGDAPSANQEMVVVGPGKILKCYDKRDKKIDDCESLLIDPIVVKRLRELSRCPQAMGLTGKMVVGFEVDFGKKEVSVKHRKKGTTLPTSTVNGVLQCAGKDFANVPLDDVAHKHKHYALEYQVSFYGPGKHPEGVAPPPTATMPTRPPARRRTRTRPAGRPSSRGTPPCSARSPRTATWWPASSAAPR